MDALLRPERLWTKDELFASPSPIPKRPGVYAWYFRSVPGQVPTDGCHFHNGLPLLYVGISPKAPPTNGRPPSSQNLFKRVRYHFRGNAEGSTLRLTLGCLLAEELGIELRRVGSGTRMTFTAQGEALMSEWMAQNALICWVEAERPWEVEDHMIETIALPLNLSGNERHPFHPALSDVRRSARNQAKGLPIVGQ